MRRRLVLQDQLGGHVGEVALTLRTAIATDADGIATDFDFDGAGLDLFASRHGERIATVHEGRLTIGSRDYRWHQPPGRAAPVTVSDGERSLLFLDRPTRRTPAPLTGPLAFPETFVVAVLAAVAVTRGGPIEPATMSRGLNFGPGGH